MVFQQELEYRRLERCPLFGKRGRRVETQSQEGQAGDEVVANRMAAGVRIVNKAIARQNAPSGRPHAGHLLWRAFGQGNEQSTRNMKGRTETWEEMCAALQMTPQRSPFVCNGAGASVEVRGRLQRRRTPYPRGVTTREQARHQQRSPNNEPRQHEDAETDAAQGSCTGGPKQSVNDA